MELKPCIKILCNNNYIEERKYSYSYVFEHRYGLNYEISFLENFQDHILIKLPNGKNLKIVDIFFNISNDSWLSYESLIKNPLLNIDLKNTVFETIIQDSQLPILIGNKKKEIYSDEMLNVDIIGSIFYLLSGYEEYVIKEKNQFGNFPHEESINFKANFLKRPLVDEYVNILWEIMYCNCDSLLRKIEKYEFTTTHDIDNPFMYYNNNFYTHIKGSLGDLIKRFSFYQFLIRTQSYYLQGKNDPYNTYNLLMNLSEKYGIKSTFYFKNSLNNSSTDHPYKINTKALNKIFINIDNRNHFIGFHPSYDTFENEKLLSEEINSFRNHCTQLNVKQEIFKVRQHYLRYSTPITSLIQEKNNFKEDSTLGYSNITGFRRGTCHTFKIFDLSNRKIINIIEKPLILMEVSLPFETNNYNEKYEISKNLVNTCKFYNGNFVLLWHNQALIEQSEKELYENILKLA